MKFAFTQIILAALAVTPSLGSTLQGQNDLGQALQVIFLSISTFQLSIRPPFIIEIVSNMKTASDQRVKRPGTHQTQ